MENHCKRLQNASKSKGLFLIHQRQPFELYV